MIKKNLKSKKFISSLLVLTMAATILYGSTISATVIWENPIVKQFFNGVKLTTYDLLTTGGWQYINVVEADTSNQSISVKPLKNVNYVSSGDSVTNMLVTNKAVFGINASFYYYSDGDGKNNDIGPLVVDGKILRCNADFNATKNEFSVLCQDNEGKYSIEFLQPYMYIETGDGGKLRIARINCSYTGNTSLSIFDRQYSTKTPGSSKYANTAELIVQDNKMVELRINQASTTIPDGGFAVVTSGSGISKLQSIFKVGAPLSYNAYAYVPAWVPTPAPIAGTTPQPTTATQTAEPSTIPLDLDSSPTPVPTTAPTTQATAPSTTEMPKKLTDYKMCIGGGGMLVKDGAALTSFSHVPVGTSASSVLPRSAVGISKDGKKVFIVGVENTANNKGMSMTSLASFMKSLGADYAMNLDGGSSTLMAQAAPGYKSAKLINTPSTTKRAVMNGIGVFVKSSGTGNLSNIQLNSPGNILFANSSYKLSLTAWDDAYSSISVDAAKATYSVSGVNGTFEGNIFTPTSYGTATITANYGGFTSEIKVNVVKKATVLAPSVSKFDIATGSTKKITVLAKNNDGYSYTPSSSSVKWQVVGSIGSISSSGTFSATANGTGYIKATFNGLTTYIPVATYKSTTKTLADLSKKKFASGGYKIPSNTLNITLEAQNTKATAGVLYAQVKYASKKIASYKLSPNMSWTGSKTFNVSISSPGKNAKISKIAVYDNGKVTSVSTLSYKKLNVTYGTIPSTTKLKLPAYAKVKDSMKVSTLPSTPDKTLYMTTQTAAVNTSAKKKIANAFAKNAAAKASMLVSLGASKYTFTNTYKGSYVNANTTYSTANINNVDVISLNTTKGGIISASYNQMTYLMNQLNSNNNYKIIVTTRSPSAWSSSRERTLFYKLIEGYYARTGKQVLVITPGSKNSSNITQGVKHLTVRNLIKSATSSNKLYSYLTITIKNNSLKYKFCDVKVK